MDDLFEQLGLELQEFSLFLLVGIFVGFLLVVVASRFISRAVSPKQHEKVVWLIDLFLIPSLIVSFELAARKILGPDSSEISSKLELLTQSMLWIAGAWLLTRGLHQFLWGGVFERIMGVECPRLLQTLATGAVYILALYGILTFVFERPVTGLMVSTGLVAGVLGLALQSTLADVFSGLAIAMERPYRVGDWIEMDGKLGKVVDITWRSTRLLSFNNSIYIIPNALASNSVIHNYQMPDPVYGEWFYVSVAGEVPPGSVRRLLLEAALSCDSVVDEPAPKVLIGDATSQPYRYMVFVHFRDFIASYAGKSDLFENISSFLGRAGVAPSAVKYDIGTREAPAPKFHQPTVSENLREVQIFEPLPNEDIEALSTSVATKVFRPGEAIIQEGDSGDSLFAIASGVVAVKKTLEEGKEPVELARLGAGIFIGEMSLMTGEPRSASVEALTECELIEVPKQAIEPILKDKPEVMGSIAEIMAERRAKTAAAAESDDGKSAADQLREYAHDILNKMRSFFGVKE